MAVQRELSTNTNVASHNKFRIPGLCYLEESFEYWKK